MKEIKPLTSLRAFFALWVLAFHWFYLYPVASTPFFSLGFSTPLFDKGYLGVDGFFVLSGFILTYNYGQPGKSLDYRDFLVNRLARIYPVHLVCLGLAVTRIFAKQALMHKQIIGATGNTWGDLVASLFLVNSWFPWQKNGWNDVAWSVSAEWFAYLAFPIFIMAAKLRRSSVTLAAIALCACVLCWVELTNNGLHLSNPHGLSRLVPEFYFGSLICVLRRQLFGLATVRFGSIIALAVVVLGIVSNSDALAVVGLGGIILGLASERDLLRRPLSIRPLIYLGTISYCLYLVQRTPQNFWDLLRQKVHFFAVMPIGVSVGLLLMLCIGSASALHHLVENPMRRIIKRAFAGERGMGSAAGKIA